MWNEVQYSCHYNGSKIKELGGLQTARATLCNISFQNIRLLGLCCNTLHHCSRLISAVCPFNILCTVLLFIPSILATLLLFQLFCLNSAKRVSAFSSSSISFALRYLWHLSLFLRLGGKQHAQR